MKNNRSSWSSNLGFILAAAGSAIGIGNLWKFPYITWENEGGAFVLIYIGCVILIGIPIMSAELLIGKKSRLNPVSGMLQLGAGLFGGNKWRFVGWLGIISSGIILSYVNVISGWAVFYFLKCINWSLFGYAPIENHFNIFLENSVLQLILSLFFSIATATVVIRGISGGIEKASRLLMPALFILLVTLLLYSFGMEGSARAFKFIFEPRFSNLKIESILEAMGQACFSLSLGMGVMITYGSYIKRNSKIFNNALIIVSMDTFVALIASIIMYTIIFTFPQIESGISSSTTGMLFTTLPPLFYTKISWGTLLGPVFYLLVVFAAFSSTISLLEVVVALLIDEFKFSRKKATSISAISIFIITIMVVLSLNSQNGFSNFNPFGNPEFGIFYELNQIIFRGKMGFMTIADHAVANWLLPLTGLFTTLFFGWFLPKKIAKNEMKNLLFGNKENKIYEIFMFSIKFVTPAAIFYIIYNILTGSADFT